VYRHIWPIVDDSLPLSVLRVEAAAVLDAYAARAGCRLVGEPRWTVSGDRLAVEVPAVPAAPDRLSMSVAILRLVQLDRSDVEVAADLGLPVGEVTAAREEMRLRPGAEAAEPAARAGVA
jgi:hypothetical protein